MIPQVDLVVLSRDSAPLRPEVERGISAQRGVQIAVHRVTGPARADDRCRWDAIARARNEGKLRGAAPWLMFLDDDVELSPRCVATLVAALSRRPAYAALAADYLGQRRGEAIAPHVSMGATLFRREALDQIRFRWRDKGCECQCCCDDLRRSHWGIDYCASARARHLPKSAGASRPHSGESGGEQAPAKRATGIVLVAFNRRHLSQFRSQFLPSLRSAGNHEQVIPVALGLRPNERAQLAATAGVTPVFQADDGRSVARQRLQRFQDVLRTLPADALVAYWDAGDVVFQARLQPLWELARLHADKLLVVAEPLAHPESRTVRAWTRGILDPAAKREARRLLYPRAWINGGFVAGTARALLDYFGTVWNWNDTPRLAGANDKGDQLALNLYCHSHPDRWHAAPEGWNYCLYRRDPRSVSRRDDGRYVDVRGVPIYVVHGNAGTLLTAPVSRQRL